MNHKIAAELKALYKKDQALRKAYLKNPKKHPWNEQIDHSNTTQLKEIIGEIGWPTISKVGRVASVQAWLLCQHADHNLKFQKKCLRLMKAEPKEEVEPWNIQYLEDRIAVSEERPQRYGTQFHKNSSGIVDN